MNIPDLLRTARRLLGLRSPSESVRWARLGESMMQAMAAGFERSSARHAELVASGMTHEEAQAVLWREMVQEPGFAESMAHAGLVARRSFWTLYEDDEDGDGAAGG